jgi:hypothetical protein
MPRDVRTHWNSIFDMLDFAVENIAAINNITSDRDMKLRQYELSEDDWGMAWQLKAVLLTAPHIPSGMTGFHRNPQESTGILRNPQESTGILRNPQESTGILRNPQESTGIHRNPQESTGILRNPQESSGIHRNPQESTGILRNPQESTGMRSESSGIHRNETGMSRNVGLEPS